MENMRNIDDAYLVKHFVEAIDKGLIQAYYQPIFRSHTNHVFCAESLARWITPEGEILAPDVFIPVLERNNLIYELDMEILRQVCSLYRELSNRGMPLGSFSVNLSRLDFRNENLFCKVISILEMYDVPHEAIKLEITESLMMDDIVLFERLFQQFTNAGFSIWLDDFGSGYSSLNMLKNYSFDVIKFDMLFLHNLSPKGKNLLASLIGMAKTLGIHTLVEGVETEAQRRFLLESGCEAMQGFYFSLPLMKEALVASIANQTLIPENTEDRHYWNQIGRLNYLGANPLKEFAAWQNEDAITADETSLFGNSVALLECSQNEFRYVYISEGYMNRVRELGFESINELEGALSNHRSYQYLMIRKLILEAIQKGSVQIVEQRYKDVYYRLSVQCLARKTDWAMLAVQLNTFDSEREVQTTKEMLNYSSALLSTYELVVLFYPERQAVTRLYSTHDLPIYDREKTIEESLARFCEAEIRLEDQDRYLEFLDFKTLDQRIDNTPKKFVQGVFRTRWETVTKNWYVARLTYIPAFSEKTYMLTFQCIEGEVNQWLDVLVRERPELMQKTSPETKR